MLIYKVLRQEEWAALRGAGETMGSPADRADGFLHFSTRGTLAGTLAKHFAGETGLILLAVDADGLGDALRWEPARGGALFPHLYRSLSLSDVLWSRAIEDGPEGPVAPGDLP